MVLMMSLNAGKHPHTRSLKGTRMIKKKKTEEHREV